MFVPVRVVMVRVAMVQVAMVRVAVVGGIDRVGAVWQRSGLEKPAEALCWRRNCRREGY